MALGPTPYVPAGMEQILAQLDNAAILERSRNMGLGDLLGGGGYATPVQPGSVPINAGYATGAGRMPYGYGSLETPTTDALFEAMRRRGAYAGGRGFLKGTGAPLGLPRATLARELQGGMYGAGGSTIGQNVIPMGNPSPIPPGAGRGAGAANMPYAQWQQASDDLVASVAGQGPYGGTRGWARNSGPAFVAESGYPRQLALPQFADQIPDQGPFYGPASPVKPASIPANAARGTGVASLPYAEQAIALGPATSVPATASRTVSSVAGGGSVPGAAPSPTDLMIGAGVGPENLPARNTQLMNGRPWQAFQGGEGGVGAAGFPTGNPAGPAAASSPGNFLTRNARFIGAETGPAAVGTGGGLVSNIGRGLTGRGPQGAMMEGGTRAAPGLSGNVGASLGKLGLALGIAVGGGALADKLGGKDTVAGQFTQGLATGGSFGSAFGLPGAIVGGLGAGIGNVGSHALQGRGLESIGGGGDQLADPNSEIGQYLAGQQTVDANGQAGYTPQAAIVMGLLDPTVNVFDTMGLDARSAREMQERYNARLAGTDNQTERLNIVKEAADEIMGMAEAGGPQNMSPTDLASMQVAASQIMAPIAADSAQLGQMQAAALNSVAGSVPEAYRPVVQQMADQVVPRSQQVANAYIQQGIAIPQLNVLDQYQNQVNQTAQQLTAQALSNTGGFGGGSTDLASLIAGASGGDPSSSADIVSALAGVG